MNEKIIINLSLLADKEKKHPFKYKAYVNAINIIKEMPEIINIEQLDNIAGIGKGIKEKINLILKDEFVAPETEKDIVTIFTNIYGIGEKKAQELVNEHKVFDLLTLKTRQDELLNDKQKIGLKYYYPLLERIPHNEMILHHKFIKNIWNNDYHCNGFKFKFEIVGSYRRKEVSSGDIDVLITFEESLNLMSRLIYTLRRNNYIIETLAEGPKKFMGICRLPNQTPRRIDIIWCSREEYPFALFYFTGSESYNRYVREWAHKKGFKLNEKRLVPIVNATQNVKMPYFETEKDIVDFLGLEYLEPHLRKR